MTKKDFKKFVKEHKVEIIAGTIGVAGAALAVFLGMKCCKPSSKASVDKWVEENKEFFDFLNTVDEASKGCSEYVMLTLPEIATAIDKEEMRNRLIDPSGKIFEVERLIAFGNELKVET